MDSNSSVDSDCEILIVPSIVRPSFVPSDDEVILTSSNVTNPNIDYPHVRSDCGVFPFVANDSNSKDDNEIYCSKCYCYVCDMPAVQCPYWSRDKLLNIDKLMDMDKIMVSLGPHCHAHFQKGFDNTYTYIGWEKLRDQLRKERKCSNRNNDKNIISSLDKNNNNNCINIDNINNINNNNNNTTNNSNNPPTSSPWDPSRLRRDNRIPDILLQNFRNLSHHQTLTTHGDLPSTPFFIEGIRIGWPFPKILTPQRQIMIRIIRALKNRHHVVLESPTGTGKSAAILCSVLAWQRYHCKGEEDRVRVYYCSRTHSQVAQMVDSLKGTPYRPRMAILGSRDRLCIHRNIRPRTTTESSGIDVNAECRIRVRNTEKFRKAGGGPGVSYADEDPPENQGGDFGEERVAGEDGEFISTSKTCPHYRQLTALRVADLAHSTFVPNISANYPSIGGKESKFGAHDIEDLINFGMNPHLQKKVAVYRRGDSDQYGLKLKGPKCGGCYVKSITKGSAAEMCGSLKKFDGIVGVNGIDVSRMTVQDVTKIVGESAKQPLLLDVTRGGLGQSEDGYSSHAACPYYISQMLSKDADLVFAPYNYVLDPQIRQAMGIQLSNAVVVLDEGHNIESALREAGSGRFGEFELCDMIVMLNGYAVSEKNDSNKLEVDGEGDMYLCDIAHALLLFVEKIGIKLKTSRRSFEDNPGSKGAHAALRDYEKYHSPDDTEFEITFHGPSGNGLHGNAVGCLPFFDELGLVPSDFDILGRCVDAFEKFFRGEESSQSSNEPNRMSNLVDRLIDLVHKMCSAQKKSEHYYAAIVARANGNLDFANGADVDGEDEGGRRFKKRPRPLPLIPPRTAPHPDRLPNPCLHVHCKAPCANLLDSVRHGNNCDGSTPKWEAFLNLNLLTPGPLMQELSNECRTVILASGSLAPIPSLCAELNLFSSDSPVGSTQTPSTNNSPVAQTRLQIQPRPLEADHVINLERQLCAVSIGHFPDGSNLNVINRNYSRTDFLEKLGDAVVNLVESIPGGGVLIFLPSYALLRKCEKLWNPAGYRSRNQFWTQHQDEQSVWDRLIATKKRVIVEPSGGGQTEFEARKQEYMDFVRDQGCCVLLAVYRGKMSEGISFNDSFARAVICIGLPLPSAFNLPIKVKMNYNDEQRKLRKRTDLLPGREWYNQQAYRAIAQALGRCIRHIGDYGAIFLLDSRHCDDGSPNDGIPDPHKNLPKWMRGAVRNLSMSSINVPSSSIPGGYKGLKEELREFFRSAILYVASQNPPEMNQDVVTNFTSHVRKQEIRPMILTPPASSETIRSESNDSKVSVGTAVQRIRLSEAPSPDESDEVIIVERPTKKSAVKNNITKRNTLKDAFRKQMESNPYTKKPPKLAKLSASPRNLKAMFDNQLSDNSSSQGTPSTQVESICQPPQSAPNTVVDGE